MLNEPPNVPRDARYGIPSFAHTFGINPLLALAMFIVDQSLSILELASFEALAVLSFFFGLLLIVPCTLVQHYADRDGWGLAAAKGFIIAIIVSTPTAIPSALLASWGIASAIGRGKPTAANDAIDTQGVDVK